MMVDDGSDVAVHIEKGEEKKEKRRRRKEGKEEREERKKKREKGKRQDIYMNLQVGKKNFTRVKVCEKKKNW